jgi:hypothetical protein
LESILENKRIKMHVGFGGSGNGVPNWKNWNYTVVQKKWYPLYMDKTMYKICHFILKTLVGKKYE